MQRIFDASCQSGHAVDFHDVMYKFTLDSFVEYVKPSGKMIKKKKGKARNSAKKKKKIDDPVKRYACIDSLTINSSCIDWALACI